MGRRKIEIKAIKDDRNRSVTFLKRKGGLFKKAHELSVLCSVDVAVFIFGNNKKLYEYSSADMRELIARYQYHGGANEHKGPSDFNGGINDDDDDDDGDGTPPSNHNGMETQMMPPHFQPQPPPPPFPQVRHHTASVSPPVSNGVSFQGHPAHLQRGHTPQPPIGSRPGSRNGLRHMGRGMAHQPVGPHGPHGLHGPHPGITYMPTPPIYNPSGTQSSLMPPTPTYPHYQSQSSQHSYLEERRPSAPPIFNTTATSQPPPPPPSLPPQGVAAGSRPESSTPQPHPPQLSINSFPHISPHQQRRHLDPQHSPPSVEVKIESSERPPQPYLNTDAAVKKIPQRKSHSIFTPIEENRSILSQHLASFASDSPAVKMESGAAIAAGPGHRSQSVDAGPPTRNGSIISLHLQQRSGVRTPSISSLSEATVTPPTQPSNLKSSGGGGSSGSNHNNNNNNSSSNNNINTGGGRARGPRLTVQIPDGGSEVESANGESISPRNPAETPTSVPLRHNGTAMVLPPPSPSAQNLLSAGATGPPNPFARPPPQQNINGDTPVSALPSRFLNNELLPSPNSFYPEWNFRGGDSNTLPSPLNFTTPVVGAGPSFLRDDAHPTGNIPASAAPTVTTTTGTSSSSTTTTTTASLPTITTTAASNDTSQSLDMSNKRKSPEVEAGSHDDVETANESKRLKMS